MTFTTPYLNDGSNTPPRLAMFLNMGTFNDLPDWSAAPRGDEEAVLAAVHEAGFEGVQAAASSTVSVCHKLGLPCARDTRLNTTDDRQTFDDTIKQFKDEGNIAVTIHAGWGLEDDAACDALVDLVLTTADKHAIPIYLETHRATITQDAFRTLRLLERHPGLKLNADYSHWYTGLEMVYGDIEDKFNQLQPAFDRAGFMHGRIGHSGSMQVGFGESYEAAMQTTHVPHFAQMWERTFRGFLANASPGDFLPLAVELLQPSINYAREFPDANGQLREESDRWSDALIMGEVARQAFAWAAK